MPTHIKLINNSHLVEFDSGKFDNWCVYLTSFQKQRYAPTDTEYFTFLSQMAQQYGAYSVYSHFVEVYELTHSKIDARVLDLITRRAAQYGAFAEMMDVWLTVIYAGMVAEENKENTILKKRIKRLGIHQLIVHKQSPHYAANFSKGKNWRQLDEIMQSLGF